MGRLDLKNVQQKGAHLYFRRKTKGKDTYIRLPDITDPNFQREYDLLAKPESETRPAPAAGTLAALVADYRASPDYLTIPSIETRSNYLRYLDMIATVDGHRTVKGVRPALVYKMRDRYAETPGKANNWLTVFRVLMAYAAKLDWRGDNPASGVRALPIGEHEPWPAELLRVCLDVATPMTRRIVVTGLCSGQRVSDAIRMHRNWIADGIIGPFEQQKTGAIVAIPMHPLWIEELAKPIGRSDVNAMTLLFDRSGKPFASTGTVQARLRDLMAMKEVQAVLADLISSGEVAEGTTFSFHGLRKNACCYLLEMGLNETEIGLMLGMSPKMVRHYGKRARALMVAREVADRIARGEIISIAGGKTDRPGPISAKKAK